MNDRFDVIVVGAGAAGMTAGAAAVRAGARTLVLERNEKVGRKIAITGKGRCNVTNDCTREAFFDAVKRNPRFLYSAYAAFDSQDVMAFFEANGVPLKVERGNRVFPQSDRAFDIVDALRQDLRKAGAYLYTGRRVSSLLTENDVLCGVCCEDGTLCRAKSVIVACGGASYPTTGSTGDGYRLAQQAGHDVLPPRASLCGFSVSDDWRGRWAGLTLKNVSLHVKYGKKTLFDELGEMLFTHTGVSGSLFLTLSSVIDKEPLSQLCCGVDLKSGLDAQQLDARILRQIAENPKKQALSLFESLLPRAMAQTMCVLCGVPQTLVLSQLTRAQRETIVRMLKSFPVQLSDFAPIDEAIVTRGGVAVKGVSPSTMASKKLEGLYFAGEVLDTDAKTGGFNLQIAFSTGRAAGLAAAAFALDRREG